MPDAAPTLRLGVLDQSPVPSGSDAAAALASTVELARTAEALGYGRYWLAEHHGTPGLAGTAPEILVAAVASVTGRIRVGAGGVLLSHYSPFKVAESFRVLDALHPGRIDLGIGRADGAGPAAAAALMPGPEAYGDEHFPRRVADLLGFLGEGLPDGHPHAGARALPDGGGGPEVWLLGSSPHSAGLAAALGLRYCFAHFITPSYGPQVVARYRRNHRPGPGGEPAHAAVAVSVVCADTDAAAERLATSQAAWRLDAEEERGPVPAPDEAAAVLARLGPADRARAAQDRAKVVVGGPQRCRDELRGLARSFGVDELVVLTVCHHPADRARSYELVAAAVSTGGAPAGAGGRGDEQAR